MYNYSFQLRGYIPYYYNGLLIYITTSQANIVCYDLFYKKEIWSFEINGNNSTFGVNSLFFYYPPKTNTTLVFDVNKNKNVKKFNGFYSSNLLSKVIYKNETNNSFTFFMHQSSSNLGEIDNYNELVKISKLDFSINDFTDSIELPDQILFLFAINSQFMICEKRYKKEAFQFVHFFCIDFNTQQIEWSFDIREHKDIFLSYALPVDEEEPLTECRFYEPANGNLIVCATYKQIPAAILFCIDGLTGNIIWHRRVRQSDNFYVTNNNSIIECYTPKPIFKDHVPSFIIEYDLSNGAIINEINNWNPLSKKGEFLGESYIVKLECPDYYWITCRSNAYCIDKKTLMPVWVSPSLPSLKYRRKYNLEEAPINNVMVLNEKTILIILGEDLVFFDKE
jgi:hypothetical protein